jgi:CheY-like chemotaxis protein
MASSARSTKKAGSLAAKKRTQPLVLLVDDVQDNREMYAEYLAYTGYAVDQASTGQEALDKAFAKSPDVIVMDLSLPGMDGWEATRRLKADKRTAAIPVVVVTGHVLEKQARGAKDAGCDSFLVKPCLPNVLEEEIAKTLRPHSGAAGKKRKGEASHGRAKD